MITARVKRPVKVTRQKAKNGLQKDLRAAKQALVLGDQIIAVFMKNTKLSDPYFAAYRKVMGRDSEALR